MQNSIIKEFINNPYVEALMFHEGQPEDGEAYEWALFYWGNHFLRYRAIWDDEGIIGPETFSQPQIGIPYGRHFIIDPQGNLALPFFGHKPRWAIRKIYETYGGDGDGDGLHDAWETENFGDLLPNAEDDPDGDGSPNGDEFVNGTDPQDPQSFLRILLYKNTGIPTLTFDAVAADQWWHQGQTRYYAVETTEDLQSGSWTDVPGLERLSGSGPIAAALPDSGATVFYRLRVLFE